VGLENVALWHERDISHSSAERIVLPDSSATLDYILAKATSLLDTLIVYPENMLKNIALTRGLVFSGQLLLALTQKGVSREDAYLWTQGAAMKVWDEGGEYVDLVGADANISSTLSPDEIARVFDLKHYLRNVDKVFDRVFGKQKRPTSGSASHST
jgi:adenylosuccinate lyase